MSANATIGGRGEPASSEGAQGGPPNATMVPPPLLRSVARGMGVNPQELSRIQWVDTGMTNRSFVFWLAEEPFICRVPGAGTGSFISRRQEAEVYRVIAPLHLSDEVVFFDAESGIKVCRFYENAQDVPPQDKAAIRRCCQLLGTLHTSGLRVGHSFDIERKLLNYEAMCNEVNCIPFDDYTEVRRRLETALAVIRTAQRPKVLCHVDCASVNFLQLANGQLKLLDWEYSGMCHDVADIAMFCVFDGYAPLQMTEMLGWMYGRPAQKDDVLLCYSYAACGGLLWSIWAEYRQYHGANFGDYAKRNYETAQLFSTLVREKTG